MSKTIKNSFDKNLTFLKFLQAHDRASKGKKQKKEIILFEIDLETNIIKIINSIKKKQYKTGKYREFKVYEPKERIIKSLPYQDRIIHQWYVEEFIKPYFYPRFIKDTYACLDNRGTHKAVSQLQKYMKKMKKQYGRYFVLKCDIKKFFYNIDKSILIEILSKKISDKKLLEFTKVLLDDGENIGIPIGNYTSQYFANIYLNELDHYIKDQLKIKYYIRYMDDFILLVPEKEQAKKLKKEIVNFITLNLHLELNQKSRYFPNTLGIDFCGYRIYETHILLRKRFKKKLKKILLLWAKLKRINKLNQKKMELSWNSFKAHSNHANGYHYMRKVEKEYNQIKNSTN